MPRDLEIVDFLKSLGSKPETSTETSTDAPAAKPEPGSASPSGERSTPSSIGSALDPTPIAKGLAGEVENIAETIPGEKDSTIATALRNWVESGRDDETGGGVKRFIGETLPFMLIPELGLGTRLGSLAARAFPK